MGNWLNLPVYGYGKWPKEEKEVAVDGKVFSLCPMTKEKQASIHIDLNAQRMSQEDAIALINKFFSHLSWFSHQPYRLGEGFSGGAVKMLSFEREQRILFEGMIVEFPDHFELNTDALILRALAFYREGMIAKHYSLPYACLSFYKILEIEKRKSGATSLDAWINKKLEVFKKDDKFVFDRLEDFSAENNTTLSKFFFDVIRAQAAHYVVDSDLNLDDDRANQLFGYSIGVMEDLAVAYIEEKLQVSDRIFSASFHKNSAYALENKIADGK